MHFKLYKRANFKTSNFAQYLRHAQISILEILNVFLWLKFSPSLILNPDVIGKHFETASKVYHQDHAESREVQGNIKVECNLAK
jgi:hypothetical protein